MTTDTKTQEAIETYVQESAAKGIDPHEARKTAEGMVGLLRQFSAPARPSVVPASAYGTLIPIPRSR